MKRNRRLLILSVILLLVVGATMQLSHSEQDGPAISEPAERVVAPKPAQVPVASKSKPDVDLDKLPRLAMSVGEVNPFIPKSWYVPPPAPPPQAPPKPTAPPLPFSYVGKMEEDSDNWTIYLSKGTESFIVKKGDTFDNNYRLDGLDKGNLLIQYLPLGIQQTLPIGAAL